MDDENQDLTQESNTNWKQVLSNYKNWLEVGKKTWKIILEGVYKSMARFNFGKIRLDDPADLRVFNENFKKIEELAALKSETAFILDIRFHQAWKGQAFTITDGCFTQEGIVPDSLIERVSVPSPNTTYTVTCNGRTSSVATTNYFGIYDVYVDEIARTLELNSWEQIARVSESGRASEYWRVGDTKDIQLSTGEVLTLQIYGFDHDVLEDSGKAGITFGLKDLMQETRRIATKIGNAYNFTATEIFSWMQGDLLNSFPSDLQSVIKTVNKKTSAGYDQNGIINTNSMKTFLFSEIEVTGTNVESDLGEGTQYPIFTDVTSRIKSLSNGCSDAYYWWLRSPAIKAFGGNPYDEVCHMISGGTISWNGPLNEYGICFGFCI